MIPPSDPKGNGTEQEESVPSAQKEALSEAAHVLQNKLQRASYTYQDVLAAWFDGRENLRRYGGEPEGDAPDFMTWLKARKGQTVQ